MPMAWRPAVGCRARAWARMRTSPDAIPGPGRWPPVRASTAIHPGSVPHRTDLRAAA